MKITDVLTEMRRDCCTKHDSDRRVAYWADRVEAALSGDLLSAGQRVVVENIRGHLRDYGGTDFEQQLLNVLDGITPKP